VRFVKVVGVQMFRSISVKIRPECRCSS